ncbi:MAG: DUF742 domain-containing protein [Actinomycetia bacterium]|nr:DUF742 domain-containing protein [Actinomycetes bacterium]
MTHSQPSPETSPTQLRVRPYLLTGGRTQTETDLPLETLIHSTERGTTALVELNLEREQIVSLCHEPISVTEVAARLGLPIQVARVIVGDLIDEGFAQAYVAQETASDRPDLNLLERVLEGLQTL